MTTLREIQGKAIDDLIRQYYGAPRIVSDDVLFLVKKIWEYIGTQEYEEPLSPGKIDDLRLMVTGEDFTHDGEGETEAATSLTDAERSVVEQCELVWKSNLELRRKCLYGPQGPDAIINRDQEAYLVNAVGPLLAIIDRLTGGAK